jgi:hypothetical protein
MHHLNHNFIRYNHPASPGDVAPFYPDRMHPSSDAHVAQHYQYQQQRADPYWQSHQHPAPLLRSMSYDQARTMPGNDPYAVHYQPGPPQHYSQMRPVPLSVEMQGSAISAATSGPHSAPIRDYHHAYPDHSRPHMLPPEMQAMYSAGARPEYPNHWYQPPPHFASVTEEAPEPNYTTQPDRPG